MNIRGDMMRNKFMSRVILLLFISLALFLILYFASDLSKIITIKIRIFFVVVFSLLFICIVCSIIRSVYREMIRRENIHIRDLIIGEVELNNKHMEKT